MKHIITIMAGLALATTASAIDLKSGTAYRIVSRSIPNATICVGDQHRMAPYIFSNQSYNGTCKDAYWYFEKQWDGSYAIYNAETKQYITYTTERLAGSCKGLKLTAKDEGATSHWFVEDSNGACILYTKADEATNKGDVYWNQRVNASDNYLVGTYSSRYDTNSLFDITTEGYVGPDPGPGPGPGPDVPDPQPEEKPAYTVIDGGADVYVVGQSGNRLTLLPKDYIAAYTISENTVTFTLADDYKEALKPEEQTLVFTDVNYLDLNVLPADVEYPMFTSYKFNNKFNYQVLSDAEAVDPTADAFTIPVSGIGKWLTASFQLSDKEAAVYIGDVLQESKVTRQRFDGPMTYTVGYKTWRQLELRDYAAEDAANSDIRTSYVPFGRQQTVTVDWLCDKSTTEYGVPRIDIVLTDHRDAQWGNGNSWGGGWGWDEPEYYWLGQDGKSTYVNAEITIDGGGAFPSMETTPILIKGRGNSTWSQSSSSKNPYHFKFESKEKPLGMTKGKHWVLLCNKQSGSMTTNAIGHRVADMMGGVAPCHIIPVDLYINDSYRGSYNLCEKVGFGNNSIALDDETNAAMVELDTYSDEKIYHDYTYYISTKMKEPDFDSTYEGPLSPDIVMEDWNNLMTKAYYNEDIAPYVDVDRLAAYLAANEAIANCELKHAKSCFAYSANVTDGFSIEASADETPWVFGPLWDCDWAFGYEQRKTYFQASQTGDFFGSLISGGDSNGQAQKMWNALLKNTEVNKAYYYKWYDFANNRMAELTDFCQEYYDFAQRSLDHNRNAESSNYDGTDYAQLTAYAQAWLQKRAEYVLGRIKSYPLPEVPVEPEPTYEPYSGQIFGSLGDGGVVGIHSAIADNQSPNGQSSNSQSYDLQGRRVTTNSQGISVTNARKTVK